MRVLVTGGSGFVGRELLKQLVQVGHTVRALVRSEAAACVVSARGAQAVRGDLTEPTALRALCDGVDVVVHLAAEVADYGPLRRFYEVNVEGTRALLEAARKAGAQRFIHMSTEAVLLDGRPLEDVDESRPLPARPIGPYAFTKALAERLVREHNRPGFVTICLRPRLVWGPGDTSLLPRLLDAMQSGSFAWIDHGTALTSTCHVRNLCAGIMAAFERGTPGAVYFLTDGEPLALRPFLEALVRPHGITPPARSVPRWLAFSLASFSEWSHQRLRFSGSPRLTRTAVLLMGQQMTVNDSLARSELAYQPVVSRDAGLAELFDPPEEKPRGPNVANTRPETFGQRRSNLQGAR